MLSISSTPHANQFAPPMQEAEKKRKRRLRNVVACDLLLASLYKNHPDHAMAALKGIEPNVIDLEPPPIPIVEVPALASAEIIPLPGIEIDPEEDVIGHRPSMGMIAGIVSNFYKMDRVEMLADRRDAEIVKARQIAMYLARKLTTKSMVVIGRVFGGKDHTTVIHAFRKIKAQVDAGGRVADEVEVLRLHLAQAVLNRVGLLRPASITQEATDATPLPV